MSEHLRVGDRPSLETQVALLANATESILKTQDEIKGLLHEHSQLLSSLATSEALRQRDFDDTRKRLDVGEHWEKEHSELWHGKNDELLAARLGIPALRKDVNDLKNRQLADDAEAKGAHGVWLSQWKAMTASATAGAALVGILGFALRLADIF